MPVRIVTDSSADLLPGLAEELQVCVVPVTVSFGEETFLDGVEIDHETFYRRLAAADILPTTSQPSPAQFTDAYTRAAQEADGIISIHVSGRLSGTVNSARQAASACAASWRIEVVDSRSTSSGLGLVVVEAALLARSGASSEMVLAATRANVACSRTCFTLETLEFLAKGGRIGRAKRLLGNLLRIKPVLLIRDGVVEPLGQPRTRAQAMAFLTQFVDEHRPLKALSVAYSTGREEAETLVGRLADLFRKEAILLTRIGPGLGAHVGAGCLCVALLKGEP